MRQRPSGLKKPVYLSDSMHKRLNTYALAATAAGVSLLACPPRAEATVVFTNTWIPITPTTATTNIDLNGDGVVDFVVSDFGKFCNSNTSRCVEETMKVLPQGSGNAVWGASTYASALSSGVGVGSQGKFQAGHELMANEEHFESSQTTGYRSRGPWLQATNRYLGVKFIIQGEVHFGWVRMDVAAAINGIYAAISGYAYETVPNKPILTSQKSGAQEQRKNAVNGLFNRHSPPLPVNVKNVGKSSITIDQITIKGADPGDFSQTNNCGHTLPGGGSCTIQVVFTPQAKGKRSAVLEVIDNGGGSPQKVSLIGTGT